MYHFAINNMAGPSNTEKNKQTTNSNVINLQELVSVLVL